MDKYIGKMLDNRYEILEIMGVGGMAYVYKARCHLLNRLVAVKILKEDYARDADFRRRFHAESQAVAMLSHPNIVAVYDVSRTSELEYIVMELIDGITLKQYMQRKGQLGWREGLHFVIQIVKALSHAHSRGIIHRDIKPHNIMILRDGSVKVADFGIARFASKQNTLTQEALGSVHYISPEQARGSHIDARSDIYSVGVVLYEMLTERLPFEGDSPVSVALQHISALPLSPREINPEIPQALEMIIIKAMAPKLTKRYASADDMLRDLEEFRKNPAISFEYNMDELKTAADDQPEEPTRSLPGGAKSKGLKLDAKREAEERKRIRKEIIDEENHKTRKSSNLIATLSAILGVLAVVAVLGYVIIAMVSGIFNSPEVVMVEVPDLKGEIWSVDMLNTYSNLHLTVEPEYSNEFPENMIINQDPLPKKMVPEGTEVFLTVSTGREPVVLDDLTGMDIREAKNWLTANGFLYDTVSETHDTVPRNFVIRTEPTSDEPVFRGDTIIVYWSTGKEVLTNTMPSVLNNSESQARETLSYYNLLANIVSHEFSDEIEEGHVISQSIAAGTEVEENTVIDLVISKGPENPPVVTDSPPPSIDVSPSPNDPINSPVTETPSASPTEESPSPQSEEVTVEQPFGIPADIVGTTRITINKNDVKYFEKSINEPIVVTITGYPEDIITVYFDDVLYYNRSIESLLQQ